MTNTSNLDNLMSKLINVAKSVDPSRISLPQKAGQIDPSTILTGSKYEQFMDVESRINMDMDSHNAPRSCYLVPVEKEMELWQRIALVSKRVMQAIRAPGKGD